MKKALLQYIVFLFTVLFSLTLSLSSYAYTSKVINQLPEKYALLVIYEVEPNKPLDTVYINELTNKLFARLHVIQLDIAIYNEGKKYGDGVRALAVKFSKQLSKKLNIYEVSNEEEGKLIESELGFYCTP